MTLHPFLRVCVQKVVPSCCTSPALQPAAVMQRPCSTACSMSHYLSPLFSKPMQGKIKGRSTKVCVKPVCTWGWRGTRWQGSRAVSDAASPIEGGVHDMAIKQINAVSEPTP